MAPATGQHAAALAGSVPGASGLTTPKLQVTIPDFDQNGEWHYTDRYGKRRVITTRLPFCSYCGGDLAEIVVHANEQRVTYHDAIDAAVVGSSMACDACASILEPLPLVIRMMGEAPFLAEPPCCRVARIRKYADALWAKDQTHLSDQWEAWAARIVMTTARGQTHTPYYDHFARDHNPETCEYNHPAPGRNAENDPF